MRLTLAGSAITADAARRTITGTIVRHGVTGNTSAGPLKVRAGALAVPDDLGRVKLTFEHDRWSVIGYMTALDQRGDDLVGTFKVATGYAGDQALTEAAERTRDGLSIDVIDARVEGDEIVSARLVAVGQVAFPAFDDARVSGVAAAATHNPTTGRNPMPCSQCGQLHAAGVTDCQTVTASTPAPAAPANTPAPAASTPAGAEVTASTPQQPAAPAPVTAAVIPAVPEGTGSTPPARTSRQGALDHFIETVTAAMAPGGGGAAAITAALADVTHSAQTGNVATEAWSDELWSGLVYTPEWAPLFNQAPLTSWSGRGWRFVQKPAFADYAGDKAEIPTGPITTEPASYEAARMAVGHDFDRKFFDFGDTGFLRACLEAVRESWAMQLDAKVRAYAIDNAVAAGGTSTSLLQAAMRAANAVKQRTRAKATFVAVASEDFETLIDIDANKVPAFLDLLGVNPSSFVVDDQLAAGTVLAGVKNAATVRTLPGSPIQVDAQHLANGGIDRAFFGYWAIETHHEQGIASAVWAAPEPVAP